ncbi:hypothetical protein HDF18_03745 [Mucilaginibacter sp. X5P1]|uniref:hypothetical protein n=1 Tax=Mucilaginibacter sp. X5P1 TaxID=2723088 RepID=UPI0016129586|nr:hypothetical protein [Mucilaginibacter sp. X5P1]MBB6136728.1 hypothetical protein [Mucilaginibacter sp. X5P1]
MRKYCTDDECLPLTNRIKQSTAPQDVYEPVQMYFNLNKAGTFTVKVKYKINGKLHESVAYVNRFGNVVHLEHV